MKEEKEEKLEELKYLNNKLTEKIESQWTDINDLEEEKEKKLF